MSNVPDRLKLKQLRSRVTDLEQHVALLESRLSTGVDKQILLLNQLITANEQIDALVADEPVVDLHLNDPGLLAPVDCPLLIEIEPGVIAKARRTVFVPDRKGQMEYQLPNGDLVHGRFAWTYP